MILRNILKTLTHTTRFLFKWIPKLFLSFKYILQIGVYAIIFTILYQLHQAGFFSILTEVFKQISG